jgi:D-glycerate 3-kinase
MHWAARSGSSIGDQRPAGERQIDAGAQVVARAQARGLNAATLSIDDVYLTRAQRQRLARQVHPC